MHINARPWLSALLLSMYSSGTDDGSRSGGGGGVKKSLQVKNPSQTWSRDTSDAIIWRRCTCTPVSSPFLSFSFFKVQKVSMKWNYIVFSSITLALRYKRSTTGTFKKGPQTDPCPHLKWKSPPDARQRSEAPRRQRWQKACVHCCSCCDGKAESTKSKCCFYRCHCLTLTPCSIHLDIFHPEKPHKDKIKPLNIISVLSIGGWLVFYHSPVSRSRPLPYMLYLSFAIAGV